MKVASPRNYWEQWWSNGGEGVLGGGGGDEVEYRRPKALIGAAGLRDKEPHVFVLFLKIFLLKIVL